MKGDRPVRNKDVVYGQTDKGMVLVDHSGTRYYLMNETEGAIWTLADGHRTVEQITEAISEEYEMSLDTVQEDVSMAIAQLKERNLLSVHEKSKARPYVKPRIESIEAEDVIKTVVKPGIIAMRSFIGG